MKIGPFFWINEKLVYHAIPYRDGEERAGKMDNPYSHEQLFDDMGSAGDYIFVPRGRVVFDLASLKSIIYMDVSLVDSEPFIKEVETVFALTYYDIALDDHYRTEVKWDDF